MAGKYTPLENYLRDVPASQKEVALSFEQIERIINARLPPSAYDHQQWWDNEKEGNHVNARALAGRWKASISRGSRESWFEYKIEDQRLPRTFPGGGNPRGEYARRDPDVREAISYLRSRSHSCPWCDAGDDMCARISRLRDAGILRIEVGTAKCTTCIV